MTSNGDSNEETEGDGKRKKLLRDSSDKSEQFILFGYLVVTIVIIYLEIKILIIR